MSDDTPGSGADVPIVALARGHDAAPRGLPVPAPLARLYIRRREQILYLVFGGWNTVFGYGVWAVLQFLLGDRLPYLVILLVSWPIAVLNAYLVYRYLVFHSHGRILTELPRFSLVYFLTLIVNLALLPVALRVLPFSIYVVQALFLSVVVVCSYIAHRYFSFGRRRGAPASQPRSDGDAAPGGLPDVR